MGILRLPRLELYWTNQYPLIYTKVREVMVKDRFLAILRALHVNDSSLQVPMGQPGYDPLFKVRKLLDLVTARFEDQFNLAEWVSIDEAMIPFKGRLSFKQYKPTKWGIKVFVLADAKTGYTKRIQIYTGKNQNLTTATDLGLTIRVVLGLMAGLEGSHIQLFIDNYYTSPTLFLELYKKGVNACGTARSNRVHFPKQLLVVKGRRIVKYGPKIRKEHRTKYKQVTRGFISHRASGPLVAHVWVDKRVIYFLSTMHCAKPHVTVLRTNPDGSRVNRNCPPCLPDYQQFMRGVDRGDQLEGYYNSGRRSVKWWKRVFTYIVEASILNAYVLDAYRPRPPPEDNSDSDDSSTPPPYHCRDSLHFRLSLASGLIGDFTNRKRVGRPAVTNSLRRDWSRQHLPLAAPLPKRCTSCTVRGQRCETIIHCMVCKVHLCVNRSRDCFYEYHTLRVLC